jgi:hypothetical protein
MGKKMSDETLKAVQRANRMRSMFALKIREFLMDEMNIREEDAQATLDNAWEFVQAQFKEKEPR